MNIIRGYPPNIDKIKKVLSPNSRTVFTYGDTIYSPVLPIIYHVVAHEEVHMIQQGPFPENWWNRYLTDPAFRLKEELEAYRVQYKACSSRTEKRKALKQMVKDLSSEMYGNIISREKAIEEIKNGK